MKYFFTLFWLLTSLYGLTQIGGEHTFQFLNYTNSARVEGVGGYLIAVKDNDPTLGVENPALLNRDMHGYLVLDYTNQFAGANFGFSSYTKHFNNIGTFNASLLYANYGSFQYADAEGILTGGSFTASDVDFRISYGRPVTEKWSVGANFNVLGSFYEQYNSFGISATLGASYYNEEKDFSGGLVIKNIGYQLNSYTNDNRESLPFNAVIAISKRLAHAPFRFSLTYHNLQRFNLLYFDEDAPIETDPLTGEIIENKAPGLGKKFMQHIVIGGEFLLSENFHIQAGYNHFVRTMNTVSAKTGAAGLSWGIGFKVKRFHLSYGMGKKHIAGANNNVTISTNIGKQLTAEDTFYRQNLD